MKVRPAEGRVVPDPARGDVLPADGRSVERNAYWRRRVAAGDVVESDDASGHIRTAAMPAPVRRGAKSGSAGSAASAGGAGNTDAPVQPNEGA
nr:DUF2635 domain-containing protein [Paraburkholderia susongensis]